MKTTSIHTPLQAADSIRVAARPAGGFISGVQGVLILAGCIGLGALLLVAGLLALPVRLVRHLLHR